MLAVTAVMVASALLVTSNNLDKRNEKKMKQTQSEAMTEHVIDDLTIPWPWRKHDSGQGVYMVARAELLDKGVFSTTLIVFDFNESTIRSESYYVLNDLGRLIEEFPDLRLEVGGHTDSQGEEDGNKRLSEARAKNVREYLIMHFDIEEDQLVAKGYGESRLVASEDSEAGKQRNRRVEFKVLNRGNLKRKAQ